MSEPRSGGGRLLDHLATASMILSAVALVIMTLVQAWQVFARYVLNDSPGWTEPVALLFMSVAVMLGSAVAVRRETHFAFLTLRDAMPGPLNLLSRVVSRLIAAAAGLALMVLGGQLMIDDWGVPLAGAQLPSGLKFVGLCVGGALILVFAVERLVTGDYAPARED
jgi:TRAP-type C4-dicarboxylate transport system permease small subunit